MKHMLLLAAVLAATLLPGRAQAPGVRAAHSASSTTVPPPIGLFAAVHGGAGIPMSLTSAAQSRAVSRPVSPRGVIPAGAGIGHHFHNVVEEVRHPRREAQFTIDGRTATVKGPWSVCKSRSLDAISTIPAAAVDEPERRPVAGVYDNFDVGDTDGRPRPSSDSHLHHPPPGSCPC